MSETVLVKKCLVKTSLVKNIFGSTNFWSKQFWLVGRGVEEGLKAFQLESFALQICLLQSKFWFQKYFLGTHDFWVLKYFVNNFLTILGNLEQH